MKESKGKLSMLVVDDEEEILRSLKGLFRRDYKVTTVDSPTGALELIQDGKKFDIILTDQRMPDMQGYEMLKEINRTGHDGVSVLVTAYTDVESMIKSVNEAHIFAYIPKPWEPDKIKKQVAEASEFHRRSREHKQLCKDLLERCSGMEKKVELQRMRIEELTEALGKEIS